MGTKLDRKDVKIFANNSDATLITEFRSESADGSTASFSRDPDIIQNANYEQGWVENQNNLNTKIFGEDMNAVNYVQSYLLKYLYENGIPEWSATTEYFEHSIARVDNRLFISLTDNNINNNPTSTVGEWAEVPLSAINIVTSGSGSSILNTSSGNDITLKSLSVDGYASLEDNGDQLNIHVIGGSGIVDAYWGQIQGTLTNQTDLVSALGAKQDNLTFDAPLSKDVNNEVSIPKATDAINGYLDATDFQTFAGKQDALSGFTHSYDTDTDTAEIYPSATNSNVGTTTYPITNINASKVNASTITSGGLFNLNGEINIRCQDGESIEIGTDGSGLAYKTMDIRSNSVEINGNLFVTGTTRTDKIQGNTTAITMQTGASIVPDTDNSYDLGSSTSAIKTIYANQLRLTSTDEVNAERLDIRARTKIWNGTNGVDFGYSSCSKTGTSYDIGTSASPFDNVYASKLIGGSAEINGTTSVTDSINFNNQGKGIRFNDSNATNFASITSSGSKTINFDNTVAAISLKSATGNTLDTTSSSAGTTLKANGVSCVDFTDAHIKWYDKSMIFNSDNVVIVGSPNVGTKAYYSHLFSQISDIRGKENIKDYEESVLNKIKGLSPITYKEKNADGQRLGLSAQNLAEIEPLCVVGDTKKSDERLSIDLYSLATLSIKAIKELNDKVEELEARVKELESNKEELKK